MSDIGGPGRGRVLSGDREISHARLFENVARAAAGLSALGIDADDTVAIMLRNDFPFFEASMAANSLGAHGVPINWHFQKDEAGYILRDSRAKAPVVHADLLPQLRDGIPEGVNTFVVPTPPEIQAAYGISPRQSEPTEGSQVWDDWLGRHEPRQMEPRQMEPRQMEPPPPPSSMIYTSGTTGNPKGVRRQPSTPETAGKFAEMVEIAFGLSPGGDFRTVVTGPMYHAAPNTYGLWTEPGVELSADAVRKFLAGRLARYKVPNAIEFCGELPREDSGKIFKRKLRDPYWEKAGRRI